MKIAGIVKNSFVDYPGLVACVLFAPRCNYDCFYCHNRQLVENPPELLPEEEIFTFLQKRSGMLDAVVVTGGEPTLQSDLIPFMQKVKALGYRLKLDTNGSNPGLVQTLLETGLCDYFAVDYKAPFRRYPELCGKGADAGKVLETVDLLITSGIPFEVRTTVAPQLALEDLRAMAQELPKLPRYVLNRYRKPEVFKPQDESLVNAIPYTQAEISAFAQALQDIQPNATA
ncbi:MAG: anaerobic ribonucleoside-triphosphate reductase activating protein [Eubacteriales bacterium]|nr:anaerobic ribonucleoside-triphosphate reductase activating protein [Eubacteriales bacterium]